MSSELETRLAVQIAIDDLLVRYIDALDTRTWDQLDTVFAPDATLDYSSSGGPEAKGSYPEVRKWLQGVLGFFVATQHMVGKSRIEIVGDTVKSRTIFHNPLVLPVNDQGQYDPNGEGTSPFVAGGWYNDTCQETPDGWRIIDRREEHAYMMGDLPPGFAPPGVEPA